MGAVRKIDSAPSAKRPPATSPQARTKELIGLAHDLAERQLREGTASAQVQTHFLKMASEDTALQRENTRLQNELLKAKAEQIASEARQEQLFGEAIAAMSRYKGETVGEIVD